MVNPRRCSSATNPRATSTRPSRWASCRLLDKRGTTVLRPASSTPSRKRVIDAWRPATLSPRPEEKGFRLRRDPHLPYSLRGPALHFRNWSTVLIYPGEFVFLSLFIIGAFVLLRLITCERRRGQVTIRHSLPGRRPGNRRAGPVSVARLAPSPGLQAPPARGREPRIRTSSASVRRALSSTCPGQNCPAGLAENRTTIPTSSRWRATAHRRRDLQGDGRPRRRCSSAKASP